MSAVETPASKGLEYITPNNGVSVLRELADSSFALISQHQFPNGLIPATLGRYDDEHFRDRVWVKDHFRATRFALNPLVARHLPDIQEAGKDIYLRATAGMLRALSHPEQRHRFKSRPSYPDEFGYTTIDDRIAPAIKFTKEGDIYYDWGHNQPDNWGTMLLETGKGIKTGWDVLARIDNYQPYPGEILQETASYVVNSRVENQYCRSIWEHDVVPASDSTMRIAQAGLEQTEEIYPELLSDSRHNGYPLILSKDQLQEAIGRLKEKISKNNDGDITDSSYRHRSPADLASLVILHDVENLPIEQQKLILKRVQDGRLENKIGFHRFDGDPWMKGWLEAKWTMGKPIMATYYFKEALACFENNQIDEGQDSLIKGLKRINDLLRVISDVGYCPELFKLEEKDGKFKPNNNDLAWTRSYIIEATATGIAALRKSSNFK